MLQIQEQRKGAQTPLLLRHCQKPDVVRVCHYGNELFLSLSPSVA